MLSKELVMKSVDELALLIRDQELSPVELTDAVVQQADETEENVNAYMDIYREEALKDAKEAEKEIMDGHYKGVYHGIPMGIKDNIYFKDKVTTMDRKSTRLNSS